MTGVSNEGGKLRNGDGMPAEGKDIVDLDGVLRVLVFFSIIISPFGR